MDIGFGEIVTIAIIIFILYGKRLPEVSRNLGKMLNNFKKSYEEAKHGLVNLDNDEKSPAKTEGLLPDNKSVNGVEAKPPAETEKPVAESELPYDKNDNLVG